MKDRLGLFEDDFYLEKSTVVVFVSSFSALVHVFMTNPFSVPYLFVPIHTALFWWFSLALPARMKTRCTRFRRAAQNDIIQNSCIHSFTVDIFFWSSAPPVHQPWTRFLNEFSPPLFWAINLSEFETAHCCGKLFHLKTCLSRFVACIFFFGQVFRKFHFLARAHTHTHIHGSWS